MWLFILSIIGLLVIKYYATILSFKKRFDFAKTIPGPTIGELVENAKKIGLLMWLKQVSREYGSTFRIWLGKDLTIFFTNPDDIRTILSSNSLVYKSRNYDLLRPWLRNGLLTNGGEQWHQKRKLLTPAFHFKILSSFKSPMEDCCKILIEKLNKVADGQAIDIYPYITLFALDVISETAMGIKIDAQLNKESEFVKSTKLACKILHHQSFSLWQRIPFLFNLSPSGRELKKALKVLHDETRRVIKLRRSQMDEIIEASNSNKLSIDTDDFGVKKRLAFLDSLLLTQHESGRLSDANIQEEVDTFMFEGHDTTSSALSFISYLLSVHSDVQKLAYEEAVELAGKESQSMPYLEAVIKEALRIYPSVPFFSRMVKETFEVGNLKIPPGTAISILAYMVHRNPKIYPDPEEFRPQRFLTDNLDANNSFAHVAFSAGPRNCIGQRFAMLELKCTISNLLRAFEFLPVENFTPNPLPELVLKSGNGILVKLKKRL